MLQSHGNMGMDKGELERIYIGWEQQEKRRAEREGILEQRVRFLVAVE